MGDNTKIEWADATWNPITGCSVVSAGCTNCYAMQLAGTRLRNHPSRAGLTRVSGDRHVWTGEVRLNEQWLDQPLQWQKPRRIFVCAHGDLFHENVPDEWIDQVFAVMASCPQHTFQLLTKRAARMREYFGQDRDDAIGWAAMEMYERNDGTQHDLGRAMTLCHPQGYGGFNSHMQPKWPLPNVWIGVSVEDQAAADERIPLLMDTPAAVRWLSIEPMLGPVNLRLTRPPAMGDVTHPDEPYERVITKAGINLHWVVVGGESGRNGRPMHPDWVRSMRDQCAEAGVPLLLKQWGEWAPNCLCDTAKAHPTIPRPEPGKPGVMFRCGKKRAGRSLDDKIYDEYPQRGTEQP